MLKSPKNAERLKQAISDFEENKNFRNWI
ncbi:queuine tRNA-ribosyltransferase [Rickettsia endosymbiont of Proechinophthirus fluctus]|nr:queuine tRNA-ribosyltransferase [Rickettsia endosymbiont of Proechinophthirus fluctus]